MVIKRLPSGEIFRVRLTVRICEALKIFKMMLIIVKVSLRETHTHAQQIGERNIHERE